MSEPIPAGVPLNIPHRWASALMEAQDQGADVSKLSDAVDWLIDNEIVTHEEQHMIFATILNEYVTAADDVLSHLGMGDN